MEGDAMSYRMKSPVTIETQLTADELPFANHFVEEAKSLQSLLDGGVSGKIFRGNASSTILPPENNDPLIGELRWKNRPLVMMRFTPLEHLPERTEVITQLSGSVLHVLDEWVSWYPTVLKPAALNLIEEDTRQLIRLLWKFDGDSAKAIEEVLRQLHPQWYGMGFDC